MKGLAILALILGLIALFSFSVEENMVEPARGHSMVTNFALFRRAAWDFAQHNPKHVGVIDYSSLTLALPNWKPQRAWVAQVEGGICYVFGPATLEESNSLLRAFYQSQAIGRKRAGLLMPSQIPLPAFIPEDSLVSLMEVDP